MPRSFRLGGVIPDDESKAKDTRDKFMAWYDEFQQFRADERGDEPRPETVDPSPYYGAESCVCSVKKK